MDARGELAQAVEQATKAKHRESRVAMTDRWIAERVQRTIEPAAVRLELWDGTSPYS